MRRTGEGVGSLGSTGDKLSLAANATKEGMKYLQLNTQAVVVALEQMSDTAREVAGNAATVDESARSAATQAREGEQVVTASTRATQALALEVAGAADKIRELRQEADSIGSILEEIRGIADQTNLLALNAAIEAARVGEQGRGFAVVADEVCSLARRSQESTEEIQEALGQWGEFKTIQPPHAEIHRLVKEVIQLRAQGQPQRAEEVYQRHAVLSQQILGKIDDLAQRCRREIAA